MEKLEVIEKIEKLLRLGQSSNEHEAALACERARQLMEKYQIAEMELKEATTEMAAEICDYQESYNTKHWEMSLFFGVAKFHDLKGIRWSAHKSVKMRLVGLKSDIEIFKFTFEYLKRTIGEISDAKFKEQNQIKNKNAWNSSFKDGCVCRMRARLVEIKKASRQEAPVNCRDLVVAKDKMISEITDKMGLVSLKGKQLNGSTAFWAGVKAANDIQLQTAIN